MSTSRALTVAKISFVKGPLAGVRTKTLGYLSISIAEDGRKVAAIREVSVTGKKLMGPSPERARRMERGCECSGPVDAHRYVDTFGSIEIHYPPYSKIVFSKVAGLDFKEKVLRAVVDLLLHKKAHEIPKMKKLVVTLWDPTGVKQERLKRQADALKREKDLAKARSKARGPGRYPKSRRSSTIPGGLPSTLPGAPPRRKLPRPDIW